MRCPHASNGLFKRLRNSLIPYCGQLSAVRKTKDRLFFVGVHAAHQTLVRNVNLGRLRCDNAKKEQ